MVTYWILAIPVMLVIVLLGILLEKFEKRNS